MYADLLQSEEKFAADLKHVLENYGTAFEDANAPASVRLLRETLLPILKELHNFHAK